MSGKTASEMISEYAETMKNQDLLDEIEDECDYTDEMLNEFRCSWTHETGIPCDGSRHYSSKSVARQLPTGEWIGWTYWFGGGKHGEPSEMGWQHQAYFLDVNEVMKPVLEFKKKDGV